MTAASSTSTNFESFGLCADLLKGLKHGKFVTPTAIQQQTIAAALEGRDVLGAAKTGSGKTLAFLIPLLERLRAEKWSKLDGLGALVITPTRELAYQIFAVLRSIGKFLDFSAGLIIGGKHVREEAERISRTNIIVCTPGRLLAHMDATVDFNTSALRLLVLDEADRILDLGFRATLDAILEHLPLDRQTLLFSATQTSSVSDLARLSLKDPLVASAHESAAHATPSQLVQYWMECEVEDKIDRLWGFVKHHLRKKILVFVQSCKQVKFLNRVLCKLQPGVSVMVLHGAMVQHKRMVVYDAFHRKQHALLIATDVAARGLDFPSVHWVLQLDCPADPETYIHRAGRSARLDAGGEALLFVSRAEMGMVDLLKARNVPITEIKANPKRQMSISNKIASLCAADIELKGAAQRAFVSYIRSIHLMSDKKTFSAHQIDREAFAGSLGLPTAPKVKFLDRDLKRREEEGLNKARKKDGRRVEGVEATQLKVSEPTKADDNDFSPRDAKRKRDRAAMRALLGLDPIEETALETGSDPKVPRKDDSSSSGQDLGKTGIRTREIGPVQPPVKHSAEPLARLLNHLGTSSVTVAVSDDSEEEDEDDFLTLKSVHRPTNSKTHPKNDNQEPVHDDEMEIKSENCSGDETGVRGVVSKKLKQQLKGSLKVAEAKKILKKGLKVNSKIKFDDAGQARFGLNMAIPEPLGGSKLKEEEEEEKETDGIDLAAARERMKVADARDREIYKERRRAERRERKLKEKKARREEERNINLESEEEEDGDVEVTLGGVSAEEDDHEDGDGGVEQDDHDEDDDGEMEDDDDDDDEQEEGNDKDERYQYQGKNEYHNHDDEEDEEEGESDDDPDENDESDEDDDGSENRVRYRHHHREDKEAVEEDNPALEMESSDEEDDEDEEEDELEEPVTEFKRTQTRARTAGKVKSKTEKVRTKSKSKSFVTELQETEELVLKLLGS